MPLKSAAPPSNATPMPRPVSAFRRAALYSSLNRGIAMLPFLSAKPAIQVFHASAVSRAWNSSSPARASGRKMYMLIRPSP